MIFSICCCVLSHSVNNGRFSISLLLDIYLFKFECKKSFSSSKTLVFTLCRLSVPVPGVSVPVPGATCCSFVCFHRLLNMHDLD
jgi:hypothetical protein